MVKQEWKPTSDNTVKWITQMSEKTGVELDRCQIRQVLLYVNSVTLLEGIKW